jgi:hypothetical protein
MKNTKLYTHTSYILLKYIEYVFVYRYIITIVTIVNYIYIMKLLLTKITLVTNLIMQLMNETETSLNKTDKYASFKTKCSNIAQTAQILLLLCQIEMVL